MDFIKSLVYKIANIKEGGRYHIKIKDRFNGYSKQYGFPKDSGGIYIINQGPVEPTDNYKESKICKIGSASNNISLLERLDNYGTYYPFGFLVRILLVPKYNEKDYEYIKELVYKCYVSKKNYELSEIEKILCVLINKYKFLLGGDSIENYKEFLNNLILFTEEYIQNKYLDSKNKLTSKYFSRCYKKPYSEKMCENIKYGEWFYVDKFDKILNDEFIRKFFIIFDYSGKEFVFADSKKAFNYNEPKILGEKMVKSIDDYFAA